MELHTIGIDLGKRVFHLVGLNLHGEVVVRNCPDDRASRRSQLKRSACLVSTATTGPPGTKEQFEASVSLHFG